MDQRRVLRPGQLTRLSFIAAVCVGLFGGLAHARGGVELVYVEPTVGSSSGGHIALRLEERVYHYQNREGWLRMERVSWSWFQYAYGVLNNRPLHLRALDLDADAGRALRRRLERGRWSEQRAFDHLDALAREAALLDALHERRPDDVEVAGAGFFCAEAEPSRALRRVAQSARSHSGFPERRRETAGVLRTLPLGSLFRTTRGARSDGRDDPALPLSSVFEEHAQRFLALSLLETPRGVCPSLLRRVPGPEGILTPGERAALSQYALDLERRSLALLRSPRPDWGRPLLLAFARLHAIELTLAGDRLVVLDAFPRAARTLATRPAGAVFVRELDEDAALALADARRAIAREALDERRYNDLENTVNRLLELRQPVGVPVRVRGRRLIPEGAGPLSGWAGFPFPELEETPLRESLRAARALRDRYADTLHPLYGYELRRRNCVTELVRHLPEHTGSGGRTSPLAFIPWVAFQREPLATGPAAELPSFRARQLAALRERDPRLSTAVRESNTWTSTLYRRNPHDAWFLFFSDGTPWPRPLFGAANLALGAAESVVGLASLPFDRGARLRLAAEGMAWSLPELVFANVRKGTFEYGRGASAVAPSAPAGGLAHHSPPEPQGL